MPQYSLKSLLLVTTLIGVEAGLLILVVRQRSLAPIEPNLSLFIFVSFGAVVGAVLFADCTVRHSARRWARLRKLPFCASRCLFFQTTSGIRASGDDNRKSRDFQALVSPPPVRYPKVFNPCHG